MAHTNTISYCYGNKLLQSQWLQTTQIYYFAILKVLFEMSYGGKIQVLAGLCFF